MSARRAQPAGEAEAFREFWAIYETHRDATRDAILAVAQRMPEFGPLLAQMTPAQREAQERESRALQRAAFLEGKWEPYLDSLHQQGRTYAKMGIAFASWFELVTALHRALLRPMVSELSSEPQRLELALRGMQLYLDVAMSELGEAYLSAKESIIGQQASAIRELSTPVLQVRDGVLILPVIGVLDTHRARQLTEELLNTIRERRARAVVIDITGVPIVDSKVANHLVQTVEAAGLMGAKAILTGISPGIAQTLVTLGADLEGVTTMVDLQSGIEQANRLLGYEIIRRTVEN
jgi:rsbT co-antagonist protein RsbR